MGAREGASPPGDMSLLELFRRMVLVREVEQTRLALWRAGCLTGELRLALGQEATAAGLASALAEGDRLVTGRQGVALHAARGLDLASALLGRVPDDVLDSAGSATPTGHLPVAVGAAMARRTDGDDLVCLAQLSESGISDGLFVESLELALRWQAPVLFACVHHPVGGHDRGAAAARARSLGLPAACVDGQDAGVVLTAARSLRESVLARSGPALIECMTYRMVPHVLSPHAPPTQTRPAQETDFWRNRDPVRRFRALLLQRRLARAETLEVIAQAARAEVLACARRLFGDAFLGGNASRLLALVRVMPAEG